MERALKIVVGEAVDLLRTVDAHVMATVAAEAEQKPAPPAPADLMLASGLADDLEALMRQRGDRHTMSVTAMKTLLGAHDDGGTVEFCGQITVDGIPVRLEE